MILVVNSLPEQVDLSSEADMEQFKNTVDLLDMVTLLCNAFKPLIKVAFGQQIVKTLGSLLSGKWVFL